MTKLLSDMLRDDYLAVLKATMMKQHHNNSSVAKLTGYSNPHIGNIFKGTGSDDAIAAVCKVLGLDIQKDLFKPEFGGADAAVSEDADQTGTEG